MNKKKLLNKIINNPRNIAYNDFVQLVEFFGFIKIRQSGSHEIYKHDGISEFLNIQNNRGLAKPYQIRQFLKLIEKHNLRLEDQE